jgi:hypothetical protein
MAEKVLTLGLTGREIKTAILDRISQRLDKDGYLNESLVYDFYDSNIDIKVRCHDVGRVAEVHVQDHSTIGNETDGDIEELDGSFKVEAKPPNEERVETGQGVPVLTKDTGGNPEIKHIRYGRNRAKAKV